MIDFSELNPDLKKRNLKIRGQMTDLGLPLNITVSEPSTGVDLEDQFENRKMISEYCFESLDI